MKKTLLTAVAAVALGAGSMALAGQADAPVQAKGGLYVGAGAGYAMQGMQKSLFAKDATIDVINSVTSQKSKFDHFAANAHVGYLFNVAQNFLLGAEFGYNYLPKANYNFTTEQTLFLPFSTSKGSLKYSQYSLDLLGVAKYYVTDEFNVFGKAGISYVNQKVTQSFVGVKDLTVKKSKIQPKVAVGVGYNLMPNLELTAEYSHTFGSKKQSQISSASLVDKKGNEAMLVDASKIPSNNTVLVGLNYYFGV